MGAEINLGDAEWSTLTPGAGQVLEVDLRRVTGLGIDHECWAAFYVKTSFLAEDGSLTVAVDYVACEEEAGRIAVSQRFGTFGGFFHFCPVDPCPRIVKREAGTLHAQRIRLWNYDRFQSCDYLDAESRKLLESLVAGTPVVVEPAKAEPPKKSKVPPKSTAKADAAPKRSAKKPRVPAGPPVPAPTTPSGNRPITDDMRDRLRRRLIGVKRGVRVGADGPDPPDDPGSEEPDADGELSSDGSWSQVTGCAPEERQRLDDGVRVGSKKKPTGGRTNPPLALEDTRGTFSKDWSRQLALQAVQQAQRRRRARTKHKKGKSGAEKLASAFLQLLDPSQGKSQSRKGGQGRKAKRGRKRRVTLPDGTIESLTESSSESRSRTPRRKDSMSESDNEAPLRKRNLENPGSVLTMLTDHVKEALDQGATTGVPSTTNSVLSGVKVMTYFMLHIKPSFPSHQRELRELHHIAGCLDTLRRGDIATTGDALAARFVAIHQSMLDANWHTARHLELFPMDDSLAAASSVVLAARRRSRLVAKAQGFTASSGWTPKGRGRGGQGSWQTPGDYSASKGDKGKGKKGKGKGKGRGYTADWQKGDNNEWKDSKEKPPEKGT